jgi:glutathione S-transferase
MSEEIVFYHNPMSRGRMVHWMLEELGAPYRIQLLNFEAGDHKKPAYLAVNPMGKIPAIVHRNTVVTECGAICTYLADAFPAANLAPANTTPARGTYLRWMFFGAGCLDAALIDRMFSRPPPERPSALSYGTYADVLNTLEKALSPGPYLLADRFSAADVYVGSQIGFGLMMKTLEPRPSFVDYAARLADRAAFKRVNEQGEKLMAQLKSKA